MTASTIVLIVLRLFALQWFVQAFVMVGSAAAATVGVSYNWLIYLQSYMPPVFILTLSIGVWLCSPGISKLVTRNNDRIANISGLTLEDLYSFAFLFLGLYFVLTSFAASINWVHYFLSVNGQTTGRMPPEDRQNLYTLSQHLVTLIAGLACMLPSRRWAQKLIRMQEKKP